MKIGKALLLALGLSTVGTAALAHGYYWHHHHYHHRYMCHHHYCYR
jgi:hypothetical protein